MVKRVGYKALCEDAVLLLKKIKCLSFKFLHYELAPSVRKNFLEVLRICRKHRRIQAPYKLQLGLLVADIIQINDHVQEVVILTSELMKGVRSFSNEDREEFFMNLGVQDVAPEFAGLGDNLKAVLEDMAWLTDDYLESVGEYFSTNLEN